MIFHSASDGAVVDPKRDESVWIVGGLGWRRGGETVESMGDVTPEDLEAAEDLGATLAVQLMA